MGTPLTRWLRTRGVVRIFIRLLCVLGAAVGAYFSSVAFEEKKYGCAAWWFFLIFASAVVELVFGDILVERRFPAKTARRLAVFDEKLGDRARDTIVHEISEVINGLKCCDTSLVRGTLHLLVDVTPADGIRPVFELFQVTDYVNGKGLRGRFTTIDQGIIGRCARTGVREIVNFSSVNEYEQRMVREFGFSKREMESHSKASRSYLAEPLHHGSELIGVLYFDSTEPQVFPHAATSERLSLAAKAIVQQLYTAGVI